VNGKVLDCIYISKYLNIIEYDRAYSLPNRDPAHTLTIDEARAACTSKGRGWHLMTNAEWTAIAHWCEKNGTVPHGNSNFGRDYLHTHEHGIAVSGVPTERSLTDAPRPDSPERTLSGSGPNPWSHDHSPNGIFDLNGNIWDYVAGVRTVDGELQVIPDNDSALGVDESPSGPLWRAINTSGALVAPGSADTYKYDGITPGRADTADVATGGGIRLSTAVKHFHYTGNAEDTAHCAYGFQAFSQMTADGVSPHIRLIQLGLFPAKHKSDSETFFFLRNYGERICARGGSWFDGAGGGLWDLYLRETSAFVYPDIGFRAAYAAL
jgi:hypothetical protein